MKKIILTSRCLLGETVRYDGGEQSIQDELELYRDRFDFYPVCPELEFGLSVPRPPLSVVKTVSGPALRRRCDGVDITTSFHVWLSEYWEVFPLIELHGALLKAKSPCCGFKTTKYYDESGELLQKKTSGLFVVEFRRRFPGVPIVDETNFRSLLDCLS